MSDVFIPQLLKQRAVYWAPLGTDGMGNTKYDDPIEIKCRWTDKAIEYLDSKQQRNVSQNLVNVDRDLEVLGVLWLGKLADVEDADEPQKNPNFSIIQQFQKVPSPNAKKFFRTAIC